MSEHKKVEASSPLRPVVAKSVENRSVKNNIPLQRTPYTRTVEPSRRHSPLEGVRLHNFPGNPIEPRQITVLELQQHLPFNVERIYWLHDLTKDEVRGHHAHRTLSQMFVAISGAFEVALSDGANTIAYRLASPAQGLYIPPRLWREIRVLESASTLLVLASAAYDEQDYIRNFDEYIAFVRQSPAHDARDRVGD